MKQIVLFTLSLLVTQHTSLVCMKQFFEKQKMNYHLKEVALKKNQNILNALQTFLENKELHKHFPGKHIPWFSYQMKNKDEGMLKNFLKQFKDRNINYTPTSEILNKTCKKIYVDEKRDTIVCVSTILCTSGGFVCGALANPLSLAKAIPIGGTFGCFTGLPLGISLANYFFPIDKEEKATRKEESL